MQLKSFDHIVITTANIEKMLAFYVDVLGMELLQADGRFAVKFGSCKINFHTVKAEFLPAALHPAYGCYDICIVTEDSIEAVQAELLQKGCHPETGIVKRNGACGAMQSIYVRDPDGNLIEISCYGHKQ